MSTPGAPQRDRPIRARGTWTGWDEYAGLGKFRERPRRFKSQEEREADDQQVRRLMEVLYGTAKRPEAD